MSDWTVESSNGVHVKEKYPHNKGKSAADNYAEHCKIDWNMCDSNKIIDINKRGISRDITKSGKIPTKEPEFTE